MKDLGGFMSSCFLKEQIEKNFEALIREIEEDFSILTDKAEKMGECSIFDSQGLISMFFRGFNGECIKIYDRFNGPNSFNWRCLFDEDIKPLKLCFYGQEKYFYGQEMD